MAQFLTWFRSFCLSTWVSHDVFILVTGDEGTSQHFFSNGTTSNDTQLWEALRMKSLPWSYQAALKTRKMTHSHQTERGTRTAARKQSLVTSSKTHSSPSSTSTNVTQHFTLSSHYWACRKRASPLKKKKNIRLEWTTHLFSVTGNLTHFFPVIRHSSFIPKPQQSDLFQQR